MNYDEIFLEGYLDALEEYDYLDEGILNKINPVKWFKKRKESTKQENKQLKKDLQDAKQNIKDTRSYAANRIMSEHRKRQAESKRANAAEGKLKSTKIKYGAGAAAAGVAAGVAGKYLYDKFIKKDKSEEEKAKNEAFIQGYNDAYMEILNEQ